MNSAQRRQARREFAHIVTMSASQHRVYFEHDARVDLAVKWCQKQFGRGSWRMTEGWFRTEFKFAREKDAVYFALKWSS
jgi:hypothetical protein